MLSKIENLLLRQREGTVVDDTQMRCPRRINCPAILAGAEVYIRRVYFRRYPVSTFVVLTSEVFKRKSVHQGGERGGRKPGSRDVDATFREAGNVERPSAILRLKLGQPA